MIELARLVGAERRFHRPPIGPIGQFLQLGDAKCAGPQLGGSFVLAVCSSPGWESLAGLSQHQHQQEHCWGCGNKAAPVPAPLIR